MTLRACHLHGDVYQIFDAGHKVVGGAYGESLANQFAASTDLLEACAYTLRWWGECGFDDEWHPSIRRKLETAIAKATGAKS